MSKQLAIILAAILGLAGAAMLMLALNGMHEDEYGSLPDSIPTYSASGTPTPDVVKTDEAVTPDTMAPNTILIPRLGIYTEVVPEPVRSGVLGIPDESRVGINSEGGTITGEDGTVLAAGHVASYGKPGALAHLYEMKVGYRWYITDAQGNRADFVTNALQVVHKANLPGDVFDSDGARRGLLVTCTGKIIEIGGERVHEDNLLVYGLQIDRKLAAAQ